MDFPTPKPKNHSQNLLTNCDLPPPLQFFFNQGNHSILRALQLSQSRARAAEDRAEIAAADRIRLASILLHQSLHLSAHKHWVDMLEFEANSLRKKLQQPAKEDFDGAAWCVALALCIGIALGRYFF